MPPHYRQTLHCTGVCVLCWLRSTVVPIRGDVEGIQRSPGRTEVLVNEGLTTTSYTLDEALVTFGAALEEQVGCRADLARQGCLVVVWLAQSGCDGTAGLQFSKHQVWAIGRWAGNRTGPYTNQLFRQYHAVTLACSIKLVSMLCIA